MNTTMDMSKRKKSAAFATPDRDIPEPTSKKEPTPAASEDVKTVTPPEFTPSGKQVRFDKDESPGSTKRGLVSRRGGRYGSPARKDNTTGVVEYKTYRSPKRETESSDGVPSLCSTASGAIKEAIKPASSISCDKAETTSPLQEDGSPSKKAIAPKATESRNVTFSPRPTVSDCIAPDRTRKTPTRSPTGGHFHNLPSLQDAKLSSPCGIFLSPCPPSPSAYATIAANPSYEEEKSSKALDRPCATPTDFAVDFGKGHQSSASFDASNVLAWLQSPTANGLFSPGGGLGSALNTPRGGAPRTPRTPTMSTSFFFSDVASLPRNGEFASPRDQVKQRGVSSMISISPLASRKGKSSQTPLKDIFSSPRIHHHHKPRGMPMLGESPSKKNDDNLDSVHMAERDLMEDEDLSVLLQLASHSNTPRSKDGSDVFRSPRGRKGAEYRDSSNPALQLPIIGGQNDGASTAKLSRKSGRDQRDSNAEAFNPPPLGIRSSSSGGSREVFTRDEGEKPAAVKSSSKDSTKENDDGHTTKKKSSKSKKSRKTTSHHTGYVLPPYPPRDGYYPMPGGMPAMPPGGSMRVVVGAPPPRKKGSNGSPPRHPGGSPPHYPPLPPDGYGGPPPGSMYPPPPHYHHHPPHMGVPPPYGHYPHPPPPRHMPMYPGSHPPQPPKGSIKNTSKKSKGSKTTKSNAGTKRPAPVLSSGKTSPPGSKKPRKTSPKAAGPPKKKKAPSATAGAAAPTGDPVDRQKAAAKIAAVNVASGGKNDRAAALAAAILRGVTMRPSGKWQAQLYYAGKSRYIGVFDTREKAALAYEIAREKLKSDNKSPADQSAQSLKATENAVNAARKAAFEGVNEKDPRLLTGK